MTTFAQPPYTTPLLLSQSVELHPYCEPAITPSSEIPDAVRINVPPSFLERVLEQSIKTEVVEEVVEVSVPKLRNVVRGMNAAACCKPRSHDKFDEFVAACMKHVEEKCALM